MSSNSARASSRSRAAPAASRPCESASSSSLRLAQRARRLADLVQQLAEALSGQIDSAWQNAKVEVGLLGAQGFLVVPVGDFAEVAAKACALAFQRLPLLQAVKRGGERVEV